MRRIVAIVGLVALVVLTVPTVDAEVPFPTGGDPYDYTRLHITNGSCDRVPQGAKAPPGSDLPPGFDCRESFKLSDYAAVFGEADYDPLVALNPQELHGRRGPGTNRAWEVSTGRPDTVIAVTDSGIRWDEDRPELQDKFFLNPGELPVPGTDRKGGTARDHDVNRDGFFNVRDFAADPRAVDAPGDQNSVIDPGDLIRAFSDGGDDDGNGYADDISGWDFYEGDNDPNDDVDYGHGTGESEDSAAAPTATSVSQCLNCMLMEMRVGDSFIADANHFAEAAIYATDNGASVIQSALGTLNHTGFTQAAVDYAYERGVLFVASAADESAGHHNQPSALDHSMVVNSVTKAVEVIQRPASWLSFNGCTNFGGYIWVSVESTSCSSDAVGQTAGMAGLLYSAARNAVDRGVIEPDGSGQPISAEEAKQLFRVAADDIDFSTPRLSGGIGLPLNILTTLPLTLRYLTTAGWDQISGFGRSNTDKMLDLVAAGQIPPEADITTPEWWAPLPASGTIDIAGRVAAPRADSFTYDVQFAAGVQPPRWPLNDRWTTVASGASTEPIEGVLATLDLSTVRRIIDGTLPVYTPLDDPTSRDLPEKDAFRVRVLVHADGDTTTPWKTAVAQRQGFARNDPTLMPGWPRSLGADGAVSGTFEDLDADGIDELIIGDGNGFVHAFKADGTEASGWPRHTNPVPLPGSWSAYGALLGGSPAVADLDGDGAPEVAVGDIEGDLFVWHHDGTPAAGFPVRGNPNFSHETACQITLGPTCDDDGPLDVRDELNPVDQAFTSMPSVGDLDPAHPGLELVAGSNDGHVYAWHADGSPVSGWPVLLRDPTKVAAVDPVTHRVIYADNANAHAGRKVLATPSLGDVDGDGFLDVAVNVNEQYEEPANTNDLALPIVELLDPTGNSRTYVLYHDGRDHPSTPAQAATPHPDDQAYLPGWPVPIAMLQLDLLPYVGEGSNASPVLADIDGDGRHEVLTVSIGGPVYLLRSDGSSWYGTARGKANTAATLVPGLGSTALDVPSFAALGGPVFGRLRGPTAGLSYAMGGVGLRRALDIVLPDQQLLPEDHLAAWNATSGQFEPGFPAQMNDLQFFATPAIADVTGDGRAEVLQASAMYDLRAYSLLGLPAGGFPKMTGGWAVTTPAAGDLDGDGSLDIALPTREGNLFVWRTRGAACQPVEWPEHGHDTHNTGRYGADTRRPGVVRDLTAQADGDAIVVTFTGTGDDGPCGAAAAYTVRVGSVVVEAAGGTGPHTVRIEGANVDPAGVSVAVQAIDDAGNRGYEVARS